MNMALLRAVSLALVTGFTAVTVEADSDRHRHGKSHRDHDRHQDYRGDRYDNHHNRHHHHGHHNHWKNGYWHHGHHHGRDGWWWINAGIWHWYPRPVYPYPSYERVVVVDRPQPAPVVVQNNTPFWYYCDSARNYYPHVSSCPEGWRAIATQPRDLN